jgi:hypothetical protein
MSLADVIRQGVEYITTVYPPLPKRRKKWSPPPPSPMGEYLIPPEEWRLLVNDPGMDRQTGRE